MPDATPITVVDTLVLHEGSDAEFAAWLRDFEATLREHPGHEVSVVRLDQPGGIVHLLHRFTERPSFEAWSASSQHRALAAAAERFAISRRQYRNETSPRFHLPGEASAPKWKRIAVSWATVFPLLLATSYASRALVPDWPRPLTLALSSMVITLMLNLIIFPRVNRRLEPWLLEADDGGVRTSADQ